MTNFFQNNEYPRDEKLAAIYQKLALQSWQEGIRQLRNQGNGLNTPTARSRTQPMPEPIVNRPKPKDREK